MPTPRLPQPGADNGNWGQILNDFLSVEHNPDGTLNQSGTISLKYTKPSTGIPQTDLAAPVQAYLGKIDTIDNQLQQTLVQKRLQQLGLVRTNRGLLSVLGLPSVMSNPPSIDVSAPNANSIVPSSRISVYGNNPAIRYFKSKPIESGVAIYAGGMANGRPPLSAEFMFDGSIFDLQTVGQGGRYRFRINGQLATAAFSDPIPSDSASYRITLDFGSRAPRHIEIELEGNTQLVALTVNAKDTVWSVDKPLGPRVIVVGDSWARVNPTASVLWSDTFPYKMGELLGWRDVWGFGVGGTGYLQPTSYRDRLSTDLIPHSPDIVIVAGGINDSAFTPQQIGDEARLLFQDIRTNLPNALLMVIGAFAYATPTSSPVVAHRAAVKAVADDLSIPFIDPEAWLQGIGQTGSQTTTGNANYYITGNHPTTAGSEYLAYRLAYKLLTMANTVA